MKSAVIQLNGNNLFPKKDANYFRNVQRYQHHTGSCSLYTVNLANTTNNIYGHHNNSVIYIYSFALEPEKLQPTGTCNFSRIGNAVLSIDLEPHYANDVFTNDNISTNGRNIRVYATNYNILKISKGMGGLLYSS